MKMIGGVLLVLCALLISRGYRGFVREGVSQAEAFLKLFAGLYRHVSLSGTPIDKYMACANDTVLLSVGFYDEYEKSQSLYSAFCGVRHRLFIPNEMKNVIETAFSEMGRGDACNELRLIDSAVGELKEMISGYKGDAEKSMRVVAVILVAAALGILIILV